MSKMTKSDLEALVSKLQAENAELKQIATKAMEEQQEAARNAETIYSPKNKEAAIQFLMVKLAENDKLGDLGMRGRLLASLTGRKLRSTTVAMLHMNIINNQLVISIDRDLYLAEKGKWMYLFGMIKGAVEGTSLRYTYNNGRQFLSVREEANQAA